MIAKKAKLQWTAVTAVNSMSGKYQTDFTLDAKQTAELISKIDAAWEEYRGAFKGKPQSLGYSEILDENGFATGIKFKATQAPQSADGKYTFKVDVYDAAAKKLGTVPAIGNGTIANVDFDIYPYTFKNNKGVKLNLRAIQILELVEYGGGSAFEAEEDDNYFVSETSFQPNI
jgi:hypothetical protein